MNALAALPSGSRAAFAAWPGPQAVALDLALQGGGFVSVPVPANPQEAGPGGLAASGATVWIDPQEGDAGGQSEVPRYPVPSWYEREPSGLGRTVPVEPPVRLAAGSVVVRGGGGDERDGGPAEGIELSGAELAAAAVAIEESLPPGRRGREILVSCRPLSELGERRLLAWATSTGAALLLEPERSLGAATAAWARPTLFHGDARELAVLRQALGRRSRRQRRQRLPFGRLHTLFVEGPLPADERELWQERGVRVLSLP